MTWCFLGTARRVPVRADRIGGNSESRRNRCVPAGADHRPCRPVAVRVAGRIRIADGQRDLLRNHAPRRRKGSRALRLRRPRRAFRTWFMRYGLVTVFIPALLPIPFLPFKAFAACAGALGVTRTRFLLVLPPRAFRAISGWPTWARNSAKTRCTGSPATCGTSSPPRSRCPFCCIC